MKNLLITLMAVLLLTGCLGGSGASSSPSLEAPIAPPSNDVSNPDDDSTPTPGNEEEDPEDPSEPEDEEDPVTPYSFSDGDGTLNDPYVLTVPEDVLHIGEFPVSHFTLTNDINMGNVSFQAMPAFSGVIYGNNFTISRFTITNTSGPAALFTSLSGTVVSLRLSNFTVSGTTFGSAIAGTLTGLISNCRVNGTINSPSGGNGVNTGTGRPYYVTNSGGSIVGSTYDVIFNGSRIFQF